ncbi:MAG: ADP-ribosylglycohydrolase family protein [Rhodothermales bacterium]
MNPIDTQHSVIDRARGCLLGLAVGDAVGTTLEFSYRGSFEPIDDMVGGGPFGLTPGQWTDDTSMALCLATSLLQNGFDPADQMRRYVKWRDTGYFSSTGRCFDIGNTVSAALRRFEANGDPFSGSANPQSAGNGSIMRLAPVVLFAWPDEEQIRKLARDSSRTTHGTAEAVDACEMLADVLRAGLGAATKGEMLAAAGQATRRASDTVDRTEASAPNATEGRSDAVQGGPSNATAEAHFAHDGSLSSRLQSIARGDYLNKSVDEIRGSGYVVESLEAALWCFATTDSFREAILAAANLGDDADTTAAVCGQIAGAHYGESGIPRDWIERLHLQRYIRGLADRLIASPADHLP